MLNTINYSQLYTEFPIISSFGLFLLGGKNKITLSILTADFLKQLFIYGCHGPSVLHGLLSSCGERGLPSTCSVRVPHSGGLLWSTGSGLMDFSSCSTWILERSCGTWLSCLAACGIFLDEGSNACPCIGRQIPYHRATTEAPTTDFLMML